MGIRTLAVTGRIFLGSAATVVVLAAFGCGGSFDASIDAETGSEPASAQTSTDGNPAEPGDSGEVETPKPGAPAADEAESAPESTAAGPAEATTTVPADAGAPIRSTPREDVPSALRDPENPGHPEPLVDLGEIQGVVPPDRIPALDDPAFEPAGEVGWLPAVEPVLALDINGDARAYPLRIMTWHELVN